MELKYENKEQMERQNIYRNACCIQDMQAKIDEYARITERLEREMIKQQELDKRILEQNIEPSMKVKLRGDD